MLCAADFHKFPINDVLLITMFVGWFGDQAKSAYGAKLSVLLTKEEVSWQELSTGMLQEYALPSSSRSAEDSAR